MTARSLLPASAQTPISDGTDAARVLAYSKQTFPNLAIEAHQKAAALGLQGRVVAGSQIARVVTPCVSVNTSRQSAARHGMTSRFKFVWQLSGTMRLDDADRSLRVSSGEAILLSMSSTYQLDMDEDSSALILMFDPCSSSPWWEAAHQHHGRLIGPSSACAAASAVTATLLSGACGDRTETFAVRSAIQLMFASLGDEDGGSPHWPMPLNRAAVLVRQNISDPEYGPALLAHDLGLSRRSLYNRFAGTGMTPADFIRQQRLRSARSAILNDPAGDCQLGAIALRNGFPDGSSLSRAFKAAYGISPSRLRLTQKCP